MSLRMLAFPSERAKFCHLILTLCMSNIPLTLSKTDYKTYNFQDPDVCLGKTKTIHMGGYEHKNYILLKFSLSGVVKMPEFCNLEISAPYNHYLGVAIEQMNLRKNEEKCIDSIQFLPDLKIVLDSIRDLFFQGSGQLCGEISPKNDRNNTYVFLSDKKWKTLDVYFKLGPIETKELINFTVAITAYRNSKKACLSHEFDCGNGDCINKELACDGHVNCAFHKDYIGVDESYCDSNDTDKGFGLPFGSTVGMVAIIILAAVGMITGAWCCTKASRQSQERSITSLNATHPSHDETFHNFIVPSAPPSYNLSPSHMILKPEDTENMPPSYESLFPNGKKDEDLT